jgi:hypothetical protein
MFTVLSYYTDLLNIVWASEICVVNYQNIGIWAIGPNFFQALDYRYIDYRTLE